MSAPREINIVRMDAAKWGVSVGTGARTTLHSYDAALAEARALAASHEADIWIEDGHHPRRLLTTFSEPPDGVI